MMQLVPDDAAKVKVRKSPKRDTYAFTILSPVRLR